VRWFLTNEKKGGEAPREVDMAGGPGEAGPKLPGHKEAQGGQTRVESGREGGRHQQQEQGGQ
jgi:hypothetical protein